MGLDSPGLPQDCLQNPP